ncbi:MAG: adenylosuccinate synthetase [Desulfurococcaceae archaeon]
MAAYTSLAGDYHIAVRTGSINAGHTVVHGGKTYKLRCISAGFINKNTRLVIPPGALIRLDVFLGELDELNVKDRIHVDYNTGIIEEGMLNARKGINVVAATGILAARALASVL